MIQKDFSRWFALKPQLHEHTKDHLLIKERDIWWCSIGTNIGHEIDGKGYYINRPVLIIRKLSSTMFFGILLTSKHKAGTWYVLFNHQNKQSCAVLSQLRALHVNRLHNRMGFIDENDYSLVMKSLKRIIFQEDCIITPDVTQGIGG